jgi:branched-chain amino acid transport system substrate-binding protein
MQHRGLSVLAAVVALAIAGCGSSGVGSSASGGKDKPGGTVEIGWVGDLTGTDAPEQGIPQLQGAKAAIEYLKTSGEGAKGVTYSLVSRDSQGDPNIAASSALELTQSRGLVAILGGGSTEEEQAMMGAIDRAKVLNFTSVEGDPFIGQLGVNKQYPWVFQVSQTPAQVVEPLVNYLTKDGEKTIAQLYTDISYGQTQSALTTKYAESKGVKVVTESAPVTATDFTAQLEKLKSSGATSLVVWSFGAPVAEMMTELMQIGWSPKVAGPLGIANTTITGAMAANVAEAAAAGPVPNTMLGNTAEKLAQPTLGFYKDYSAQAGSDEVNGNTMVGIYGFDEIMVINAAIKATNSTDPTTLRNWLDSGKQIQGAQGTYVYGPDTRVGVIPAGDYGVIAAATKCSGGTKCKGLS